MVGGEQISSTTQGEIVIEKNDDVEKVDKGKCR